MEEANSYISDLTGKMERMAEELEELKRVNKRLEEMNKVNLNTRRLTSLSSGRRTSRFLDYRRHPRLPTGMMTSKIS